jgi:hypothetical protein
MTQMGSLSDKGVSSGLLRYAWGSEVAVQGLKQEIVIGSKQLTGQIQVGTGPSTLPKDKMIIDITREHTDGARSVTMARRLALSGLGVFGSASRLGVAAAEEDQTLEYVKTYSNDWFKAVTGQEYGISFRELEPYGIHKVVKDDLARWYGELYGMMARQAWCQGLSANLASSPVSGTQYTNPNLYIMGGANSTQPKPSGTAATMLTRLGDGVANMTSANARTTVPRLISLAKMLESGDRYFETISVAGKDVMILFMHPDEFLYMWDPSVTNSFGAQWASVAALQEIQNVVPGAQFLVADRILVVEDLRAPTLTVTGTSGGGYTASWGYVKQGRKSTRTTGTTANQHLNVNILAGANSLYYLETEAPHYVNQMDDYEMYNNIGFTGAMGFTLNANDIDSTSDTGDVNSNSTMHSEGSMLVLTQRAST